METVIFFFLSVLYREVRATECNGTENTCSITIAAGAEKSINNDGWLVGSGLVASSPAAASLRGTASNRQNTRSVAAERAQFPGKVGVRDASGYPKYCDSESARHGITIMRKIE